MEKDPALLKHQSRSSSFRKEEKEAFETEKKEWEEKKQSFIAEFNKEKEELTKKLLALENKEEVKLNIFNCFYSRYRN